jgi:XRE family aerobic/anaerobic benzoate catabolism transcriptional regulator
MVASRIKADFIELDAVVEQAAGLSLGEIFSLHGEDYYRRLERVALRDVLERGHDCVIAPGGSVVTDDASWSLLKRRCLTVWLHATPEEFMKRLRKQGDTRPMQNRRSAMAELRALLSRREPLYAQSAATIKTTNRSPESIVREIEKRMAE